MMENSLWNVIELPLQAEHDADKILRHRLPYHMDHDRSYEVV